MRKVEVEITIVESRKHTLFG